MKTEFEGRTRRFALAAMSFVNALPKGKTADVIGYQLVRSATSIGANYREAQRGVSKADFIHKIALAEKEASETCYWLELLEGARILEPDSLAQVQREAGELLAIFTTIGKRTKNPDTREDQPTYEH